MRLVVIELLDALKGRRWGRREARLAARAVPAEAVQYEVRHYSRAADSTNLHGWRTRRGFA